jgi:hypothetical protein
MKGAYSTGWIAKTSSVHKRESTAKSTIDDQLKSYSPLPASAYTTPRTAPKPPSSSIASSLRSVFLKAPVKRTPSSASLRSANSATSHISTSYSLNHPFSNMVPAHLPVVSSLEKAEDEEDCPVCLEPLSFSFRLPGEKPHIVPECGHALHEVPYLFLLLSHILSSNTFSCRHVLPPSMAHPQVNRKLQSFANQI